MKHSLIRKRSIVIDKHRTSVSLEAAFWNELRRMARQSGKRVGEFVGEIDHRRNHGNLSSALRLAVLVNLQTTIAHQAIRAPMQQQAAE